MAKLLAGRQGWRWRRHRLLWFESLETRQLLTQGWLPMSLAGAEGESTTQVAFRLEATDLAGQPIENVLPGDDFYLSVWVSDVRETIGPAGVYAAYLDVAYDSGLLDVVSEPSNPLGFDIEFGEDYLNGTSGRVETPGLIDEVGGFQVAYAPLGPGEIQLFHVRFSTGPVNLQDDFYPGIEEDSGPIDLHVLANDQLRVGTAQFLGNPAEKSPLHDVLLFSPPTVVAPDAMRFQGTEVSISDGNQHAITQVTVPLHGGVVQIADDGASLRYTPPPNFSGSDTFTYTVGASSTATVTVVVEPVDDPPIAGDDLYSIAYGDPFQVGAEQGVLSNDHDVEGDLLTAHVVQEPAFGSLSLQGDGGFEYIPDPGFRGRDQFTYVAQDDLLASPTATVVIDVGRPQVGVRLELVDEFGQSVDHAAGVESLTLRAWVHDLRDELYFNRGIYATYFDLLYDAQTVQPRMDEQLPRGFDIRFGTEFFEPGSGDASLPGMVDEVGSFSSSFLPPGSAERLLFEMPFDVAGPRLVDDQYDVSVESHHNTFDVLANDQTLKWTAAFESDAADLSPDHDVLLYDPVQPVAVDQIQFSGTSVELANDPSLTIVGVSSTEEGGLASISADQRHVVYVPPEGFTGTDAFVYTVSDSHGRLAQGTVVVDVIASWQNIRNPLDVNGDSYVSPIDVLMVITDLNHSGARPLVEVPTGPPYIDVNGDGSVSPIDGADCDRCLKRRDG